MADDSYLVKSDNLNHNAKWPEMFWSGLKRSAATHVPWTDRKSLLYISQDGFVSF